MTQFGINTIVDAPWEPGIDHRDMPATPEAVRRAIRAAAVKAAA